MVAVKLTLAVLAVVIGVAAAIANPTTCSQASDVGFYCVSDPAYSTKYFWCSNPGPASIPGWFSCAPGTVCGNVGQNLQNPCTFATDLCPSDPLKTAPGVCGCGVADTDSDGDGTPNCNDGCPNDPMKTAPGVCGCGNSDSDICCGQSNGFTCQGTLNTGMYVECSAPFYQGPRACAPGTKCKTVGFTSQNPCA